MNKTRMLVAGLFAATAFASTSAMATCKTLTTDLGATGTTKLGTVLINAVKSAANTDTGGYGLPMWVTLVDETGTVCAVTTTPSAKTGGAGSTTWGLSTTDTGGSNPWGTGFTGKTTAKDTNVSANGASNVQWLASRVISMQKANTANSLSVDKYAISTANLYSAVLEGNSLYGLQHSNPVNAAITYTGIGTQFGSIVAGIPKDPMVNKRPGGINVFGGGLALYKNGKKIGAVGVSGDTSCRDHAFAWTVRSALSAAPGSTTFGITNFNVDASGTGQTALAAGLKGDEMIFTGTGGYWDAWSHPMCPNTQTGAWSVTAP